MRIRRIIVSSLAAALHLGAADAAPPPVPPPAPAPADSIVTDSLRIPEPTDGLVVTYFHARVRCPDCVVIETIARDVVETDFARELKTGQLHWRSIDYEDPKNKKLATHYDVEETGLVIAWRAQGKEIEWRVLPDVWDLVEDSPALADYILYEIDDLIAAHRPQR